jgi:hypothetical protein
VIERNAVQGGVGEIYVRGLLSLLCVPANRDAVYVDCIRGKFYRSTIGIGHEDNHDGDDDDAALSSNDQVRHLPKLLVVFHDADGLRKHSDLKSVPVPVQNLTLVSGSDNDARYVLSVQNANPQEYVVDSIYFGNFNTDVCDGHAIAGLTCDNARYIYNGWARHVVDLDQTGYRTPCRLMKMDWMTRQSFCLNQNRCVTVDVGDDNKSSKRILKSPKASGKHCYNSWRGSRVHFAVRKDIYDQGLQYDRELMHMASMYRKPSIEAYNPATKTMMNIKQSQYARWKAIREDRGGRPRGSNAADDSGPRRSAAVHLNDERKTTLPKSKKPTKQKNLSFFAKLCGGSSMF